MYYAIKKVEVKVIPNTAVFYYRCIPLPLYANYYSKMHVHIRQYVLVHTILLYRRINFIFKNKKKNNWH